ncbi:MAG: hypothetical protein QM500_19985 [Methylococcales bacterium]
MKHLQFSDIEIDKDRINAKSTFDQYRKENPNAPFDDVLDTREYIINGYLSTPVHSYD